MSERSPTFRFQSRRTLLRIGLPAAAASTFFGYLSVRRGPDVLGVLAALLAVTSMLLVFFSVLELVLEWRERWGGIPILSPGRDADDPTLQDRWRVQRIFRAREFMPREVPAGWQTPVAHRKSDAWVTEIQGYGVHARIRREGSSAVFSVTLIARPGQPTASDALCTEVLSHFRNVQQWMEGEVPEHSAGARKWLAVPFDAPPRFDDRPTEPATLPTPRSAPLTTLQIEARRYFPEVLPEGWSVPTAMEGEHSVWMFDVEDMLVMLGFCTVDKSVKLVVSLIGTPGDGVSETYALGVLKHFQHVAEFVPADLDSEVPNGRMYLGTLLPGGRYGSARDLARSKASRTLN